MFFNDETKEQMKNISGFYLNSSNQTPGNVKVLVEQIKEFSVEDQNPLSIERIIRNAAFWGALAERRSSFK